MNDWRLLKLETHTAFMNMAIDEAILEARIKNVVPNTIRLYQWKPSAVSIGKFQNMEKEAHLDNCRKNGVDIVRRITGGGAVYHDAEGEITYSVIASEEDLNAKDIADVYAKIYSGLSDGLRGLGLTTDFREGSAKTCPNLTINGKKISGSAQSHKKGTVLQHGTFLVDVDLEKMFTFLKVPWAKTRTEAVNAAKHKITSIKEGIGQDVAIKDVDQALIQGFQRTLRLKLINGELTPYEQELAKDLYKKKYLTDEWNIHGKSKMSE
jgi:lipoate-protein ligase A